MRTEYNVNDRVEMHPATDQWMQGDRYGTVVSVLNKDTFRVQLDRSGRVLFVAKRNLLPIGQPTDEQLQSDYMDHVADMNDEDQP